MGPTDSQASVGARGLSDLEKKDSCLDLRNPLISERRDAASRAGCGIGCPVASMCDISEYQYSLKEELIDGAIARRNYRGTKPRVVTTGLCAADRMMQNFLSEVM